MWIGAVNQELAAILGAIARDLEMLLTGLGHYS